MPVSPPQNIHFIELSYLEGQTLPNVTFHGQPETAPNRSFRPSSSTVDLLAGMGPSHVFGTCQGYVNHQAGEDRATVTLANVGEDRCGMKILLRPDGGTFDLLSYATVRIRGQATGRITIALEDQAAALRDDNVRVVTASGLFDLTLPLSALGRSLDLRQMTGLVFLTEESTARIVLEEVQLHKRVSPRSQPGMVGFWIWRWREALADPERVWAICRQFGCSRVLIQLPASTEAESTWAAYAQFLARTRKQGIEVVALDGYPEAASEPRKLADKIRWVLHRVEPGTIAGVQLDIEPYLLPGFFADELGARSYLEAIDLVKEVIGNRASLSVVIPFWFTSTTVGGRPLAFCVMDRVDEVAVMSYRTNLDELIDIADDMLRYGELIGIPVWLALETTKLPVEHRVVMKPEPHRHLADAILDRTHTRLFLAPFSPAVGANDFGEGFRIHSQYTVRPERITFSGRSRTDVARAVNRLRESVPHTSFAGVLIHDLQGFIALAE